MAALNAQRAQRARARLSQNSSTSHVCASPRSRAPLARAPPRAPLAGPREPLVARLPPAPLLDGHAGSAGTTSRVGAAASAPPPAAAGAAGPAGPVPARTRLPGALCTAEPPPLLAAAPQPAGGCTFEPMLVLTRGAAAPPRRGPCGAAPAPALGCALLLSVDEGAPRAPRPSGSARPAAKATRLSRPTAGAPVLLPLLRRLACHGGVPLAPGPVTCGPEARSDGLAAAARCGSAGRGGVASTSSI